MKELLSNIGSGAGAPAAVGGAPAAAAGGAAADAPEEAKKEEEQKEESDDDMVSDNTILSEDSRLKCDIFNRASVSSTRLPWPCSYFLPFRVLSTHRPSAAMFIFPSRDV